MKRFFQQLISDLKGDDSPENEHNQIHSVELAAAVIFLEMASMDNDLADIEMSEISEILKEHYHLSEDEIEELLRNADEVRKSAVDFYQFTRTINEAFDTREKTLLMEQIWRVIYADGRLDKHEDHLVHKLANLLRIEHKDLIETKLKIKKSTQNHQ